MISKYKIAWLLNYFSIATFSAAIITPALPLIQLHFHLGPGEADWMVSAFLSGYVIGQLIYGPLANRWGSVFSLRTGLVINLIGVLVCLLALGMDVYWMLIMGRILSALGSASGLACTFMLINEKLTESLQKTVIAYSIFSFTLGIGLAVFVGGLITDYWQWSGCFFVLLIHGCIMLLGTYLFHGLKLQSSTMNILGIIHGYTDAFSSKTLVIFSLAVGFSTAITYCFATAAPQISNKLLHLSAAEYGYWNVLNVMGMLVGGLWSNTLLKKFRATKVVLLGLMLSALSITSFLLMWTINCKSVLWFFGNSTFLYVFGGLIFSGGSFIASNAIKDKANGASIMSFINMFSAMLAVVIMPWLSTDTLLAFGLILAGMWMLIVSSLLYLFFFRQ